MRFAGLRRGQPNDGISQAMTAFFQKVVQAA
jgi:hypothetical protein